MTLHAIVRAVGGDLYQGGARANIPAPGHSRKDRSISLWLSEGRLIVHGFGGADWRAALRMLREQGLIDADGRIVSASRALAVGPDRSCRIRTARDLWEGAGAITPATLSWVYLKGRRVMSDPGGIRDLRHHACAPISVYRDHSRTRPAMAAGVRAPDGELSAVELTYLDPNGRRAIGLRLSRKTVGLVPAGAAVRLAPAASEMLVAEGVITALSAIERFDLPGWALMSAGNLAAWTPPDGVRRVLIAADRGAAGQAAAECLRRGLAAAGLSARIRFPDLPFGDWNEAADGTSQGEEKGG
ncbi:MAG: toprim domain-containing protein [Brevundimonas sp.]|jgi:hypothetical protein|uniref:toprim domain-containing protein n=1 Tax=Brevundimonas sp. TaxID=1871086 RepID=UPI0025BD5050|nr:toprim domain-containing protein [Brevundimonas sp.]MCH4269674.1 toprim domain-containing protein [Brevundimonas sp.]